MAPVEHNIRAIVRRTLAETPVTDIHTHLYAPAFGDLLLSGLDEMLAYHYLTAETLRNSSMKPEAYFALPIRRRAEMAWQELFVERSPVSEACRGVLTAARRLGLSKKIRDLDALRLGFSSRTREAQVDKVFRLAGLREVVMTNDPFDAKERKIWERGFSPDGRFHAALRVDPLFNITSARAAEMRAMGFKVRPKIDAAGLSEIRRFLKTWIRRMRPLYLAASFEPPFDYAPTSLLGLVLEKAVLPVCRESGRPFAMMLGVKRGVRPTLRLAGDGVGACRLETLESLCLRYPHNKFMATVLSRENQHQLAVIGRKFSNLLVFGCWWFMNVPSLVEETLRMRVELLGLGHVPQHSDARVLEQLIYKWDHSRRCLAKVLEEKYSLAAENGWTATPTEIRRDVKRLLGGAFWEFLERSL
jgi:hypothetical protein